MDKIDELLVPTYNKLRFHGLSMIEVNDLKTEDMLSVGIPLNMTYSQNCLKPN